MGTLTANGIYKPSSGENGWGDSVNTNFDYLDGLLDNITVDGSYNITAMGIGTTSHSAMLQVESSDAAKPNLVLKNTNIDTGSSALKFWKGPAQPLIQDDEIGNIEVVGSYDVGSSESTRKAISFVAADVWSSNDYPTKIEFYTTSDATAIDTKRMEILANGGITMASLKSGATQVASGAGADELWVTSSHATLPDNVVMIGV